jgi:hypothetical protein
MKTFGTIKDTLWKQTVRTGRYIREKRRQEVLQRERELDSNNENDYARRMNGTTRPSG